MEELRQKTPAMSSIARKTWNVLRHGLIVQTVLDVLLKVGIEISPFYLFEEGIFGDEFRPAAPDLNDPVISIFGPEEFGSIGRIPDHKDSEARLLELLKAGNECYGLKTQDVIVGYTWVNPNECRYRGLCIPLGNDEAYLFNMMVVRAFRGKNAAAYLRYSCVKELERQGRTKCLSVSSYFTAPALRFKEKLGAKIIGLYLHVELFGRWGRTWTLKNYAR